MKKKLKTRTIKVSHFSEVDQYIYKELAHPTKHLLLQLGKAYANTGKEIIKFVLV